MGAGVGYRDGEGFRAGDVVQGQDEEFEPMQGTERGRAGDSTGCKVTHQS